MIDLLKELEQCLIEFNNPVLEYLDSGTPFDPNHFANMLDLLQLDACEDLNALYSWKPGLKRELVNDLNFNFRVFNRGTHIEYTEALHTYQILVLQEKEIFENRFFPFILMPGVGFEAPILIDLSKNSKTFGRIFYDSPATGITKPTSIFDSLSSMIETIIACYRTGIYSISKKGILNTDTEKILAVSSRINPNSDYWKDWE